MDLYSECKSGTRYFLQTKNSLHQSNPPWVQIFSILVKVPCSEYGFGIRIRIHKVTEYGSNWILIHSTVLDPRSATLDLKYNDVSNPSAVKDVEYDTLGKDFQIHKAFGQTQTLVKVMKEKQQQRLYSITSTVSLCVYGTNETP